MSSPLPAGTKLGRYVIRSLVGTGGMGEVYLADDTLLRRPTAIKLLIGDFTQKEERLHRFEREAYAASSLNHPNIVTIYEVGSEDGHHFIATEFVDGYSLRRQARISPLDFREVIDVAIQVASALTAAHETGIIHRDIKPENIMLRKDGYVKVLDFGLAKLTDEAWHSDADAEAATQLMIKTEPGRVMGTIDYMSPEQARGREVDPRSDIFSLGVVLYELVAGVKPFCGDTKSDVLAAVLTADAKPLVELIPNVSAELNRIVNKCLRKNREERYQSTKELLVDLKNLKQELEFEAKLGLSQPKATVRPKTTKSPVTRPSELYPSTISELFIKEAKTHPRRTVLLLSIIGVGLLVGGIAIYKLVKLAWRTDSFQNMRLAKLTSTGDVQPLSIAVSPDGKYVVYATEEAGETSLWVRHVATSSNVPIVPGAPVAFTGLTFSPDGSYVYYIEEKRESTTLYQVPVLGGSPRKLIDDAKGPVTFSPDGSQFAFRSSDASALMIANADGNGVRTLATRPNRENWVAPAWSPKKDVIVAGFRSLADNRARLTEISTRDGTEKPLPGNPWLNVTSLAWVPDGTGLVLSGRDVETKVSQLWFIDYPGGNARRITNDLSVYSGVSLTSDGSTLISVQSARVTNIWVAANGDANLARKITSDTGKDEGLSGLSWTPDGHIIHSARTGGDTDLWITDSEGKTSKQLTLNAGRNMFPSVTPDGRYIVVVSDRSGRNELWRTDIDGRNPLQLANVTISGIPDLSPDGKWVFFQSQANKGTTIWKTSIDGGQPVQVTPDTSSRPLVAPDGHTLLCVFGDIGSNLTQKLKLLSLDSGGIIRELDLPQLIKAGLVQWNTKGDALIYRDSRNRTDNLWSQDLDGGPPKQLTQFSAEQIFAFDWSRDGKTLVVVRGRDGSDVVSIKSFH